MNKKLVSLSFWSVILILLVTLMIMHRDSVRLKHKIAETRGEALASRLEQNNEGPSANTVTVPSSSPRSAEEGQCPSLATDKQTVERVVTGMESGTKKGRFLSWKENLSGEGDVQAVFIYNETRYTVYFVPPASPTGGRLSFFERPDETHSPKILDTYADNGPNGCVNFGIGNERKYGPDQRALSWKNNAGLPDKGTQYHDFWQERYNRAMRALAQALK
ncbi:MAG TPA: hypothetical protein VJB99_01125 [Patescibacteria group bacterium]|nr:hypothetical protein [Patescibacteria group bacterium]